MPRPPEYNIDLASFWRDPYPVLAELRQNQPVAYVPQLQGIVLTRRADIATHEKMTDVFSSHQPDGLMNKLMGRNLMRKDGAAHLRERKAIFPSLSPVTARDHWRQIFQQHADRILDRLNEPPAAGRIVKNQDTKKSATTDLVADFALPFSADCLRSLTGLTNLSVTQMDSVSQAMIDGIANYSGDADIEAQCHEATQTIDHAIDQQLSAEVQPHHKDLLTTMRLAEMPIDSIRANIKLAISGGQNEPRDAIAGTIWALLKYPDQLQMINDSSATWMQAFEEYSRWISPIGMSPRRIAKPHTIHQLQLLPEDKVFLMFSSANRDEQWFQQPDQFDITRDNSKSIPFGAGPHFCAGAWTSKTMIAQVALPSAFKRLKQLALVENSDAPMRGWAFRGLSSLPVEWQLE